MGRDVSFPIKQSVSAGHAIIKKKKKSAVTYFSMRKIRFLKIC
jgi:hypothetical protein